MACLNAAGSFRTTSTSFRSSAKRGMVQTRLPRTVKIGLDYMGQAGEKQVTMARELA